MRLGTPGSWLQLARISNLPTTWTNVMVGAALIAARPDVDALVVAAAAVSLSYVGGMILNDVVDAERDRRRGQMRPIPTGRVDRRLAGCVSGLLLAAGPLLVAGVAGVASAATAWAAALVACVVAYNVLKERGVVALVLMGACRGLILPLAASLQLAAGAGATAAIAAAGADVSATGGVGPVGIPVAVAAIALAAYVTLVTIAARGEHEQPPSRDGEETRVGVRSAAWRLVVAPAGAVLVLVAIGAGDTPGPAASVAGLLALLAAAGWTSWTVGRLRRDGAVPAAVMRWLAGICLFDLAVLLVVGAHWSLVAGAIVAFVLTRRAHARIAGS